MTAACIYCARTEPALSDEHIIAEGLGGNQEIPAASCKRCREATSKAETRVLRNGYGLRAMRSFFKIGKRRKLEKPTHAAIEIDVGASREPRRVRLNSHPLPFTLPLFELPSHLTNRAPPTGVRVRGYHQYLAGEDPSTTLRALGVSRGYMRHRNYDHDFAKMLAKIGYCAWHKTFGTHLLTESWLPTIILNCHDVVGQYVGTLDYALRGIDDPPCLHTIHLSANWLRGQMLAYARIQLFIGLTPCPTYMVVVGRLGEGVEVDPNLAAWYLPPAGVIGAPLAGTTPRWVGTTLFGKQSDGGAADILQELRDAGLSTSPELS